MDLRLLYNIKDKIFILSMSIVAIYSLFKILNIEIDKLLEYAMISIISYWLGKNKNIKWDMLKEIRDIKLKEPNPLVLLDIKEQFENAKSTNDYTTMSNLYDSLIKLCLVNVSDFEKLSMSDKLTIYKSLMDEINSINFLAQE